MKAICWDDNDDNICFWQKSWIQLYRNVCDFAIEQDILSELLDYLELQEEEE